LIGKAAWLRVYQTVRPSIPHDSAVPPVKFRELPEGPVKSSIVAGPGNNEKWTSQSRTVASFSIHSWQNSGSTPDYPAKLRTDRRIRDLVKEVDCIYKDLSFNDDLFTMNNRFDQFCQAEKSIVAGQGDRGKSCLRISTITCSHAWFHRSTCRVEAGDFPMKSILSGIPKVNR
jgi:hypothetical protein